MLEKALTPWVIVRHSGEIESAHCNCMAGLAEACTHVASMIFKVEHMVRTHHDPSVTEVPACWMGSSKKAVEFERMKDIDFATPHAKLEKMLEGKSDSSRKTKDIPLLTNAEKQVFLQSLMEKNIDVASSRVTSPFCNQLRDRDSEKLQKYPPNLGKLLNQVYRGFSPK